MTPSTPEWMKRPWFLIPTGLAAGALAFGLAFWLQTRNTQALVAEGSGGGLAWLRTEFGLTSEQFERVAALHEAYKPVCADLCRRVMEENGKLERMAMEERRLTEPLRQQVLATGQARDACRAAMLEHLYAVARELPPEAAERYLRMMLAQTCVIEDARPVHAGGAAALTSGHERHHE
jgi:hypothetical protein